MGNEGPCLLPWYLQQDMSKKTCQTSQNSIEKHFYIGEIETSTFFSPGLALIAFRATAVGPGPSYSKQGYVNPGLARIQLGFLLLFFCISEFRLGLMPNSTKY